MTFTRTEWTQLGLPPRADSFVFASGGDLPSLDPATGAPVAVLRESTLDDCEAAIAASRDAARHSLWATDPALRSRTLYAWGEALASHERFLSELLTREQGKPLAESHAEVRATADQFRFYAGLTRVHTGRSFSPGRGVECVSLEEPMGVVGVITPWNWPLILLAKSLAPALAAGNTAVIKPPELTTAVVLSALEFMLESTPGLEPGIVCCVLGSGPVIGSSLVGHRGVDMVAFTGSAATGREVAAKAAAALQPVTLELGGKSPTVVFDDADREKVISGILTASVTTAGQMCTAGSRVLAQESIAPYIEEALSAALAETPVGDGLDARTGIGPIISERQMDRVRGYIDMGKSQGNVVFEGETPKEEPYSSGYFVPPIVFDGLPQDSGLHREEIFGPVITVQAFATEEELVEEANATVYGLSAGVWTSDVRRAWRVARGLDVGTVWVNTHNQFYPEIESGVRKQSGYGDVQGVAGLSRFTQAKLVDFDARPTMW